MTTAYNSTQPRPLKSIAIIGNGLRAVLPAAYLAARCGAMETRITVIPHANSNEDQSRVITRPNIRHLHQLLRIPEKHILGPAQGRRLYAIDVESKNGNLSLPFGPYGEAYKGIAFAHIIKRLKGNKFKKTLSDYNLNLALHAMEDSVPFIQQADFGYSFPRHLYAGMLSHYAAQLGAQMSRAPYKTFQSNEAGRVIAVETQAQDIETDCVIITTPELMDANQSTAWVGNCLYLPPDLTLPGNELYRLHSVMERMNAFMPDRSFNAHELGEFNRLSRLEGERMNDMSTLLKQGSEALNMSSALKRKIDVYSQRGRIPIEDYEVFTSPEWHAALMGFDIVPRNYDRLADGHSEGELQSHIDVIGNNIKQLLEQATIKGDSCHV